MSDLPAHVVGNPRLGTWITATGPVVEVHIGKVELGQGILTALAQVAADALGIPLSGLRIITARTSDGPDQGLTAGSLSISSAAPALQHVGAVVRALTGGPLEPLAAYVEAIRSLDPDTDLTSVAAADSRAPRFVGRSEARLDLPDKVLGRPTYLADLRPAGLHYGRVLRPPSVDARLVGLPDGWEWPGVELVRDGSFVGVVGVRESDVDRALERLRSDAQWDAVDGLPEQTDLATWLRQGPHDDIEVVDDGPLPPLPITASFSKPFLAHASMAPSVGLAVWEDGRVHIWSHSQGIHALRDAIGQTLRLRREDVTVEHVENAGCYGHNAADDAALDAVLLARAVPGHPVQARWTRADELTWGPLSSAMTATAAASLVDGRITGWQYDVWSQGHTSRPGARGAPALLAGAYLATPVALPTPTDPPVAFGGGTTRNAVPRYNVGPRRITGHRKAVTPIRTSAMRALGAYLNVFAIECFMDELAQLAGADPVEFRIRHLTDPRAAHVIETAARLSGWTDPLPADVGRGIGFARYKDVGAWCAVVAEVAVVSDVRVRTLTIVADVGTVVNPDGARNQLEGGATQATSWTLKERVQFDRRRIVSDDWAAYPILRFTDAPSIRVQLVDSRNQPLGAGETAQGPTAAAIANAVYSALGVRVRDLPLDRDAITRAINA